jgi:hypothetical protein
MGDPWSRQSTQQAPAQRPPHRIPRPRGHQRSSSALPPPPDLAEVARTAVVNFLRDQSADAGEQDATLADETAPGADTQFRTVRTARQEEANEPAGIAAALPEDAAATALRAAALSVATLDRIESAAAQLEADIAAARQEQAELQAGAGTAAEAAVRAAQEAWTAASAAEGHSEQARRHLRTIGRYMVATIVLVLIQVLFAVAFAASAH